MNALAGLMNPLAVGQMVQQGYETGKQQRAEMETRNALGQLVTDPMNQEAMQSLARYNPQAAMGMQDRQRQIQAEQAAQQKAQQEQDLFRRAMSGDGTAMDELANVSFDKWSKLDGMQKKQAEEESKIFGNAALDILNRPPEQRGAAIAAYAQQLGTQYPEVAQIVQLPPEQQEAALRAAVAEAQMVEKLIGLEQPKYMAVARDADMVNLKDPAAIAEFGRMREERLAGPQAGTVEDGFRFKGGDPGDPNNWEKVGGPTQSASGNFPG